MDSDFTPLACVSRMGHLLSMREGLLEWLQAEVIEKGIGEILEVIFLVHDGRISATIIGNVGIGKGSEKIKIGIFAEHGVYLAEMVEGRMNRWIAENNIGDRIVKASTSEEGITFLLVVGKVSNTEGA